MIRKFILAFAVSGLALGAAACNTVQGAGEDIESVGKEAERAL